LGCRELGDKSSDEDLLQYPPYARICLHQPQHPKIKPMKTEESNIVLVGLFVIIVLVVFLLLETVVAPSQPQSDRVVNTNETSK